MSNLAVRTEMYSNEADHLDSLTKIIKSIPTAYMRPNTWTSLSYLGRDLFITVGLVAAIVMVKTPWLALPLSLVLGVAMTGLFVLAHDAGHRSFSKHLWVNNLIGECLSSLLIWPFHVWRLSHDTHHRHTHHITKEIAWRPFSAEKIRNLSPLGRGIYLATRSWAFMVGSIFFTFYFVRDALRGFQSRHFKKDELAMINRSIVLTAITVIGMISGIQYFFGWYGIVFLFVIPQLVFQVMMSTFTFFHHTHPDTMFMEDGTWDASKAQLASTIHVNYPHWIERLTHDISWHIPHHVCVGIPHYHLRAAHSVLRSKYQQYMHEETLSLTYIKSVIYACQIAGERGHGYVPWERYQTAQPETVVRAT